MTLREIFRFELACQSRRVSTWLYFVVLLAVTLIVSGEPAQEYARMDGSFSNGPFLLAVVTLFGSTIGLLIVAAVAGEAAARDVQTRMDSLLYTTPVDKRTYLAGRFLAALTLCTWLLSAVPIGLLLASFLGSRELDLVGPFRPGAHLGAYVFLLLPNAFVATAIAFSLAALSRRGVMSYLGGVLLLGACALSWGFIGRTSNQWALATLLDPLGATHLDELAMRSTPAERSTRLISLQGVFLWNRVLWIGIAIGALAFTQVRFRMAHHTADARLRRPRPGHTRRQAADDETGGAGTRTPVTVPSVRPAFGFTTRAHQLLAVASESFQAIVRGWGGVVLAVTAAFFVYSGIPIAHMGVPLVATTERIIAFLAAPLTRLEEINAVVVPLLIVFYAGQLIWREREARLSEIGDAAPVPEWVFLLGRFAGLSLMLVVLQALMAIGGMLTQLRLGYDDLQIGLYARALFGLQLADCLLFALLALVVHTVVNHKFLGHLAGVLAYLFIVFASALGVQHNLLIYGSDPGWTYSDMRGFDPFIAPWLWFKLYWTGWAALLAVAGTLFWVRGKEPGVRLALARRRVTPRAAGVVSATLALVLMSGGFIFYNTNVLNAYRSASEAGAARAEYERRYGRYKGIPQPQLEATTLRVEIYPRRGEVDIHGTFLLVNRRAHAIGAIHLATSSAVTTTAISFDRPAKTVLDDHRLGHRIYALDAPLQPGASLRLDFEVQFRPRGFPNRDVDASVVGNGTYFTNQGWLPALGYQPDRELRGAGARRKHELVARPTVAPDDLEARHDPGRTARIAFDAVVGTDQGQVAVAPGRLVREWTDAGRRYFHYVTDAPIRNDYAFFSAAYAVREGRWNDVSIQILHHPTHPWNADRMVRSTQASLDYYSSQFGPYPHRQIRLVEHPGGSVLLHAAPVNISFQEAFSLLNPDADGRNVDLAFAVVAHEVAHQWWGGALTPADVEGAGVLTESLAWYSALQVVERTFGREHLERLLTLMRQAYVTPRARADVPLLRADDWFLAYRKGPLAMHALREYIGAERVNISLRRLLDRYRPGRSPLATPLDLYRELQAVTPESLHYLLVDLFQANTFWALATDRVSAEQTTTGDWRVTLDVEARKTAVDTDGVETDVPMTDLVEIGVFAAPEGEGPGDLLYLEKHPVRSGAQRITVTVSGRPAQAGVDPRRLLIDMTPDDNAKGITGRASDPAGLPR
jgi:ABC-type transport system involved in multi-copper enzyme maturation permease subunit